MLTAQAIPQMVPPETVLSPTTLGSSPTRSISRRVPRWKAAARYPPPESDSARLPSGRLGSEGAVPAAGWGAGTAAVDAGEGDVSDMWRASRADEGYGRRPVLSILTRIQSMNAISRRRDHGVLSAGCRLDEAMFA